MHDFWERYGRIMIIGAIVVYALSIILWLGWGGALFMGAAYGSLFLTVLAGISAICYPIIIVVGLIAAWRFHHQNQFKKSMWAVMIPVLYIPVMLIIGVIAMIEGA